MKRKSLKRLNDIEVQKPYIQKMIEEEWNIRKMNFFERVYSDVDSVLALSIYDPCKMFKESD